MIPFTLTSLDGFANPISLALSPLTTGLETAVDVATVNPTPDNPVASATMIVHAGASAVGGTHTVELTAHAEGHGLRAQLSVFVGVTPV
jgi:hypothetical protein